MKIQLDQVGQQNAVRAYAPGRITINEDTYTASLIITPERIIPDWPPRAFGDITEDDIAAITALEPEVVLLGTGDRLRFPAPALTRPLIEAGVGFEVMDTWAACRTYNVLMSEGRRVAAALLIEVGV
ncbi:MAG TPA: Mth938-like domain-containing protein [Burkholderiales bacterium]